MKSTICMLTLAVAMLPISAVESQVAPFTLAGSAAGSTFYYTDFSDGEFGGWTSSENIQQDSMPFNDREEMWVAILPNAAPPGSVSSPAMPFKRGAYNLEIIGRCMVVGQTVDVEFFIGERSIGRSWFAYEESTAKRAFYVEEDMEGELTVTVAGGTAPMLALAEVIILGPM